MREVDMPRDPNWMHYPPHNNWMKSMSHYIADQTRYRRSKHLIFREIGRCPPPHGCDDDTRLYIKLAIQIAEKQNNEY